MAKKKKTQLKPVARGFAVTSVPKKVVQVVEENKGSAESTTEEGHTSAMPSSNPDNASVAQSDVVSNEEQALQSLIDRFQDRTERDVVRTLKVIEQERRFAESLTRLELTSPFIENILSTASESSSGEARKAIEEAGEKALPRLAVTYGVLRRIGFTESRVEECLRAIGGVDLDEAFDWLHIHCSEEELGALNDVEESGESKSPKTSSLPQTPLNQDQYPIQLETSTPKRFDGRAPGSIPEGISSLRDSSSDAVGADEEIGSDTVSPAGSGYVAAAKSQESQLPVDDSDDDPNAKYVRLKMQIADLTTHRQPGEVRDTSFLRGLQRRLEEVKQDYLFDGEAAEAQYRIERARADASILQARLRGEITAPAKPSAARHKVEPLSRQKPSQSTPAATEDLSDSDDDSSCGMLDLLEMPATGTTEEGVVVTIRDMDLPKQWSGRTPQILLAERVHKVDKNAAISYSNKSGASRAQRASVQIRWSNGKTDVWSMDDIATRDMFQAEQYISTVALHALAFPSSEGFAIGATMGQAGPTSFRQLPGPYRDLWDELEQRRRTEDNATNRTVWAKLRSILEPKLNLEPKPGENNVKPAVISKGKGVPRNAIYRGNVDPEQVKADFEARRSRPAYQEMLYQRGQLPIAQYREEINTILESSSILVLSGETGCGKSTQVPAFILEDHLAKGKYCKILCTEPRRISAISLAQRVSRELGESAGTVGTAGSIVGYSIRLENKLTNRTRLAYVTNGIALRMLEGGTGQGGQGTAFDEITHIIIDEVHERTIESDFLLIVLKSLLQERPDLRVVLMSATVEAEKISNYFGGTPTLSVPGRTFPVDVRYLEDAIEFTKWRITERSPYARRGRDKFHAGKVQVEWSEDTAPADDDDDEVAQENVKLEKRYSANTAATINLLDERVIPYELIIRLLEQICFNDQAYSSYSSAILIFMPGIGEIRRLNDMLMEHPSFSSETHFKVYPLHSTISSENQNAVFDTPPQGIRKIVIATNIAETGITIPDITCVIDTGKQREMRFDEKRQISRLTETFVAKSNAAQRRGRAGRVQSGLCFHLFTKIRHDTKMAAHPDPEMLRLSLSELALRIKIMKVKLGTSIEDVLCKALDPPLPVNIQRAVSALVEVRALTSSEEITPMGRLLSKLPTDVHLGKFLLIATLFRCLDPALTIAATLNSKSPFMSPLGYEQEAERAKLSYRIENSDFMTIHNAFASWRQACANGIGRKYCKRNYLSYQNLQQIEELRQQFLGDLVDSSFIQVSDSFAQELSRARYSRGRTRFVSVPAAFDANTGNVFLLHASLCAGLYPKILAVDSSKEVMKTVTNNQSASFHPSSVNFGRRPSSFGVNHLCYFTLMQSKRLYAWETAPLDDIALVLLCGEPEFKLASDAVYIDRKIKFRVPAKSGIALKLLRSQLDVLLSTQMRQKPLVEAQTLWNNLAMMVLGKVRPKDSEDHRENITLVVHR